MSASEVTSAASRAGEHEQAFAEKIVRHMLEHDAFSRWLGVETLEIAPRRSVIRMTVRPEMVNGFGFAHGGIAYSLADSALAFACNTHGRMTVALENSMGYPASASIGDVLTATAVEESAVNRVAFYHVTIRNQHDTVVALFRGTVYRTKRNLLPESDTHSPTRD